MRVAIFLLLVACRDVPPANYPTTQPPTEATLAPLGIIDVIEVVIYNGTQRTNASFRLDPTGKISVQYIGDVGVLNRSRTSSRRRSRSDSPTATWSIRSSR